MEAFECINGDNAELLIKSTGVCVIDVRNKDHYDQERIAGAVHVSPETLERFTADHDKKNPVLCYCYHGFSSQQVAHFLTESGFQKVYSLDGGFEEWKQNHPTETPSNA